MSASTPPLDVLTGWRYPRTQPSLAVITPETRTTGEGSTL